MTEQEFLEKRVPFWIQGDDLEITFATGSDRNEIHSHLSKKYHYNWLFIIRLFRSFLFRPFPYFNKELKNCSYTAYKNENFNKE